MSTSTSPPRSLLFPPNPSLSPIQPPNSILLNCPARTPISPSSKTVPPSPSIGASPTLSASSLVTTDTAFSSSSSHRPSSSVKIHFAPLPQVPPELKRRSSITLGVAARKGMLSGGESNGTGGRKGTTVLMTDEEWDRYRKQFESKHGPEAVDLGQLAMTGAKTLWRKVRSGSQSSVTSTSSNTSNVSSASTSSASVFGKTLGIKRRESAPAVSPQVPPQQPLARDVSRSSDGLGVVFEEDGIPEVDAPQLANLTLDDKPEHIRRATLHEHGDGDATPRRRPSPPPPTKKELDEVYKDESPGDERDEEGENGGEPTLEESLDALHRSESGNLKDDRHWERNAAVLGFDNRNYGPKIKIGAQWQGGRS